MPPDELPCARCQESSLNRVGVGKSLVDRCPSCHGVWFDSSGDELRRILECGRDLVPDAIKDSWDSSDGQLLSAAPSKEPRLCPRCRRPLARYWYLAEHGQTFLVDGCLRGHGVWLDSGELGKAQAILGQFADTAARFREEGIISRLLDSLREED